MVLTDEFANNLKRFVTLDLVTSLTKNFEILNTIGDTIYYKVSKDEFNPLHDQSAIANFNYTGIEFFPTYADDELIESVVRFKQCPDNDTCRNYEDYDFTLLYTDEEWLVDDIGVNFNETI